MPANTDTMKTRNIVRILFIACGLTLSTGLLAADTAEKSVESQKTTSEYRKDSDIIDVNILRKRALENPRQISTWIDNTYGFQFVYPSHLKASRQIDPETAEDGGWSWFSEKNKGQALVSVALPSTPRKTTIAEIRIGVSEDTQTVSECRKVPQKANPKSLKAYRYKGDIYTFFKGREIDAGKITFVNAYRTIHDNRCYSIELTVYGTNPESMSKPDYAAMKPNEAMTRLRSLWRHMDFQWLSSDTPVQKEK